MIDIIPATMDHAQQFAPLMAVHDVKDIWERVGLDPSDVPVVSVRESSYAWAGFIDNELSFLFGIVAPNALDVVGAPWFMASDRVYRNKIMFLRRTRHIAGWMLNLYPTLEGYVDPRHKFSVIWLKWLGFVMDEPREIGKSGIIMQRFTMEAAHD